MGISGGIDSAVLAYIATRAIGPEKVMGLIMPDENVTPSSDVEDALRICSDLKIDSEKIYTNRPKNSFLRNN